MAAPIMPTAAEIAAAGGARHMVKELVRGRLLLLDNVVVTDAAYDQVFASAHWSWLRALKYAYLHNADMATLLAYGGLDVERVHAVYERVTEAPLSTFITANDNYANYTSTSTQPAHRRALARGKELRAELERSGDVLWRAVYIGGRQACAVPRPVCAADISAAGPTTRRLPHGSPRTGTRRLRTW
jgi:hypothetical protein